MLDENQLTVIDENGNELLCEILFTFDSDDYNKSYVVYYPAGAEHEDEDGNVDYTFLLTFQAITMKVENYFQLKQMLSGI